MYLGYESPPILVHFPRTTCKMHLGCLERSFPPPQKEHISSPMNRDDTFKLLLQILVVKKKPKQANFFDKALLSVGESIGGLFLLVKGFLNQNLFDKISLDKQKRHPYTPARRKAVPYQFNQSVGVGGAIVDMYSLRFLLFQPSICRLAGSRSPGLY
jgi:hypothetical protein